MCRRFLLFKAAWVPTAGEVIQKLQHPDFHLGAVARPKSFTGEFPQEQGKSWNFHADKFLHLAAGAAALPTVSRDRMGASVSHAASAHDRSAPGRRLDRRSRAPDGSVALRTPCPALPRREPARGRLAISALRRSCVHPPTDTRYSWSTTTNVVNAHVYDKLNFNFTPRHRASRGCHYPRPMSWWCIHQFQPGQFPSLSPTPGPIQARSIWRRPAMDSPPCVR